MVKEKKSVTFQLVSASNADERSDKLPWQRTLLLKESPNDIWKNRKPTKVPSDLLKNLEPHDFGIHENLNKSQKQHLIRNIYGNEENFKKFESTTVKTKKQKVVKEEDLEDDCYFPKDGYDYEQHLATINPKYFIPLEKTEESVKGSMDIENKGDFPDLGTLSKDPEVEEVLEALQSENELEAIDDDFVTQAMNGADEELDEDEILWGGYKPMIPVSILDKELKHKEEEELDDLDLSDDIVVETSEKEFVNEKESTMTSDFGNSNPLKKEEMSILNPTDDIKEKIYQILENESEETESYEESETSESEKWDVETVLTTYTNSTNHPKMILSRKIKIPKTTPVKEKGNEPQKRVDIDHIELPEVNTLRVRGETLEEKKERKMAVKKTKALIKEIKRNNKESLKEAKKKNSIANSRGSYDLTSGVKYLKL